MEEKNELNVEALNQPGFGQKIDFNTLVWRQIDRIGWLLSSMSVEDSRMGIKQIGTTIFALKASITGLECLLAPKLAAVPAYWSDRKKLFSERIEGNDFKTLESMALAGKHWSFAQQHYVNNFCLPWLSLLMQQLPKIKMIRQTGGELESAPSE